MDFRHHHSPSKCSSSSTYKARDDTMELVWHNGQVVAQSQPQRVHQKSTAPIKPPEYIGEDEMGNWLHYPEDLYTDLLYPTSTEPGLTRFRDPTGITVVESNRLSSVPGGGINDDVIETSSTSVSGSGSGMSGEAMERGEEGGEKRMKKRKGGETDVATAITTECHTQDVEHDSGNEKKYCHGSTAKKTRAAQVHNRSERKRRDRINEKMKALQELIPRCNKSDKASMLDEAIEYLKSLQMQVQMMSMGCGMVPMMYPPGMQQPYMPPMAMGIRPMMPFPTAVPPSTTGAPPQLTPRFSVPTFPMYPVPQPCHPRKQANTQCDCDPVPNQTTPSLPQIDPYQQYMVFQQMQMQMQMQAQTQMQAQMHIQSVTQPGSSKPSSKKTKLKETKYKHQRKQL